MSRSSSNLDILYSYWHTRMGHLSHLYRLPFPADISTALLSLGSRTNGIDAVPEVSGHSMVRYILKHSYHFAFLDFPESISTKLEVTPLLIDGETASAVN